MKIKTEVKVGIISIIVIAAFIWGYNFMKGRNLVKKSSTFYALYEDVNGLNISDPVLINGYKVGLVEQIEFTPDKSGELLVKFSIEKDIPFANNSVADIYSIDLMGSQAIRILFGDSDKPACSGDTLPGKIGKSITDMINEQILPIKDKAEKLFDSLDSLLLSLNDILNPEFRENINTMSEELSSSSKALNKMLSDDKSSFNNILANTEVITARMENSFDQLSYILENMSSVSDSIAQANIKTMLINMNQGMLQAQLLLRNMNEGMGTVGQLMTNDSLYYYLEQLTRDMDILMKDLKENPKRYVSVSVFGGKN